MSSILKTFSKCMMVVALVLGTLAVTGVANAQQSSCPDAESCANLARGWTNLGLAFAAALAVGIAGLATGIAQKDIGAAAVGAVAEDPGFLGKSIIFLALPETIVLFGLLIAFQLVGKIV